jgi:hypothetical protein
LRFAAAARQGRQVFVHRASGEAAVSNDVDDVVALILGRQHRMIHLVGRMIEGGIHKPTLPCAGPDRPAEPRPRIVRLAMPIEMPDVARFEVDGIAVVRTQDRDARVRTVDHV